MAVSARVSSITKNFLAPKVAEGVLQSNVGLTRFISAAKPWRGAQEEVPFKHSKNTQGGSFDGFDVLSTTSVDNRIKLTFDPKFTEKPTVIPLTDLAKNMTEERVLDLMEIEMESTAVDMADDLGTQFFSDGTGNGSKDMTGLAAIVDDGTSVAKEYALA